MKIIQNRILGKTESQGLIKTETRLIDFVPSNDHFIEDLFYKGTLSLIPINQSPFANGEDYLRAKVSFTIDKSNNAIAFNTILFGVDLFRENPVLELSGAQIGKWLYLVKISLRENSINYENSGKDYPVNNIIDSLKALIYNSARI
jgi:hypothetical protein